MFWFIIMKFLKFTVHLDNMDVVLSLIIPVKNEGSNLIHLCQSLSVQEFKDSFEVVIVDDSDFDHAKYVDSCVDILRGREVRVKYLRGSGDGVGSAMFRGLSASGGRYVYFLDADNILRKDFMVKVIPRLKEDVAVSFLSRGVILKGITGLFYGSLLLAALRGGLKFHRRYGFVGTHYIWRKDVLMRFAEVKYPKLSMLDQINFEGLIKANIAGSRGYVLVDEVLVIDTRHVYENFGLMFIYRRFKWYWSSYKSLKRILGLRDVKLTLMTIPILIFILYLVLLVININMLLILMALYACLLAVTSRIKANSPFAQLIIGVIWLPVTLIVRSGIAYTTLFSIGGKDLWGVWFKVSRKGFGQRRRHPAGSYGVE